jgi:hypothetical protein
LAAVQARGRHAGACCDEHVLDVGNRVDGGAELDPVEFSWSSSDVQLCHLSLGAGADPLSERELRYLEDDSPQVLPTLHASEAVSIPLGPSRRRARGGR